MKPKTNKRVEFTYGQKLRKNKRRKEAQIRKRQRDERSSEEQIAILDERLGKGIGAKKERERLNG